MLVLKRESTTCERASAHASKRKVEWVCVCVCVIFLCAHREALLDRRSDNKPCVHSILQMRDSMCFIFSPIVLRGDFVSAGFMVEPSNKFANGAAAKLLALERERLRG